MAIKMWVDFYNKPTMEQIAYALHDIKAIAKKRRYPPSLPPAVWKKPKSGEWCMMISFGAK